MNHRRVGAFVGLLAAVLTSAASQALRAAAPLQAVGNESLTIVSRQVAVLREQCLQSARDVTLTDLRASDEARQRSWCDATREARRREFGAAFVESVRRASDGGGGLAGTLAEFLRTNADAIKPLSTSSAVCADEKLRIDEVMMSAVVDRPSLAGSLFGVNLNGKRVSRLNPVPRWERLLKEGVVLRSTQMAYAVPLPVLTETERAASIERAQAAVCPSTIELDRALAARAAEAPAPGESAAATDSAELVAALLTDSYQRERLGPLVQLAQASARLPGLSPACDRDLRILLTDNELARRVSVELAARVNPTSLHKVLDIRRPLAGTSLFSKDGDLRLFHPEDNRQQARILDVYGKDGRAAFVVDAADVTVSATQALALGLYGWSSARSDLIARGCLSGRQ